MIPQADGTLVPQLGRYYFLADGAEFEDHSQLGGHWFENKPYQTGPYSTAMTPKPKWVNGAIPEGAEWPDIHCCGLLWQAFTPTRTRLTIKNPDDFVPWWMDATTVIRIGETVVSIWDLGFLTGISVHLACALEGHTIASQECGPAQLLTVFFDPELAGDPEYRVSLRRAGTQVTWPPTSACIFAEWVKVDFYGSTN